MNWGAIIMFSMIVVLGELNKAYEKNLVRYSCPESCRIHHVHFGASGELVRDSLQVAEGKNQ
tara:strand:+ start:1786 stop:1971 length:186 start_codon:yes stop_codon:yes gene_type:complete